MSHISREDLLKLRNRYPEKKRVRLTKMDGETLPIGLAGSVRFVDDIGTIHVGWDNGSSLGVVHGIDSIEIIQ